MNIFVLIKTSWRRLENIFWRGRRKTSSARRMFCWVRTKVHKHGPTRSPNIFVSKKKAQHNFCSFRFKVSIHKVFHQQQFCNRDHANSFWGNYWPSSDWDLRSYKKFYLYVLIISLGCMNVKELLAWNRHDIWRLSDCNGTRTHNHLVECSFTN